MPFRRKWGRSISPAAPLLGMLHMVAVVAAAGLSLVMTAAVMDRPLVWPPPRHYVFAVIMVAVGIPTLLSWTGGYRPWRGESLWREVRWILIVCVFVQLALVVVLFITKTSAWYSRAWLLIWFALTYLLMGGGRVALRLGLRKLRAQGVDTKRVVMVGGGQLARTVVNELARNAWTGFKVEGYFAVDEQPVEGIGATFLGHLEEVVDYLEAQRGGIDQVWLVVPLYEQRTIRRAIKLLGRTTVDVRLVPDMFAYRLLNYSVDEVAGMPLLNLSYSPFSGPTRFLKDAMDKVFALGIILLISPVLAVIALAVKLTSRGPVIFRQLRHGWDGEPFEVYKFRTMTQAASSGEFEQATRNDVRVTHVGSLLRRTSLDELPQFFNVVGGSMSIVGPRPHAVEMNNAVRHKVDRYMLRHKVKPGITGWAQVNGYRGETETLGKLRKRVEYDLYYIEHWSFALDMRIIMRTVLHGFWSSRAY